MYAKSAEKREMIVDVARQVFLEKGYAATNMADIIEACGISRGGLYFYFSSVEELFIEVLKSRKRTTAARFRHMAGEVAAFGPLLDEYFAYHKERLQNMENSLLSATLEFSLAHRTPEDRELIRSLYEGTKDIIRLVLAVGVGQGCLASAEVDTLADHILYTIEGLSTASMTAGLPEATIDAQFALLKHHILRPGKEETP